MKKSGLVALVVATLVVLGGAVWLVTQRQSEGTAVSEERTLLPGLMARANDVAAIAVTGPKMQFRIVRGEGDTWTVPDKSDYPAKADVVKKTVLGMAELKALEPRTSDPERYASLGVGEPGKDADAVGVSLQDKAGNTIASAILGKVKNYEMGAKPAEIYVRLPSEKRSWLAAARLRPEGDVARWVDNDVSRIGRDRMLSVTISHPGDVPPTRVVRDTEKPKEFALADKPADRKMKSEYETSRVASALDYLIFDDVQKAEKVDFTKDPFIAIFRTVDGLDITARTVAIDGKFWTSLGVVFNAERAAAFKPEEGKTHDPDAVKKEAETLSKKWGGWAYQVSSGTAESLTRRADDMTEADKKDEDEKKG
jgi:hypothetical protein